MSFSLILGFLGLFIIFIAYVLNNWNKFKKNKRYFYLRNILGSCFLAYYSFEISSIPFLILQVFWILASLYSLFFDSSKV